MFIKQIDEKTALELTAKGREVIIFQAKDNGISIKLEDWEDEQRNYCSGQNPSDVPAHKREQRRGMPFRWNCVSDNTERCVLPFAVWK